MESRKTKESKPLPLKISPFPKGEGVQSLKAFALNAFAKSKQGFFTPNTDEQWVLMAVKNSLPYHIQTLPEVLGHYAAWGMQKEAEELLSSLHPDMLHTALTTTVSVKDYADRAHSGTAFELALKMGDVTHDDNFECMAEMLVRHMRKLENGQAIIAAQFHNIFGDDFDAHLAKQQQNAYSLDGVIAAINEATEEQLQAQLQHEDNGSRLNKTIAYFREQFAVRSSQDEIFNPYHFLSALQVYNEKIGDWNWNQWDLFWRQIIGDMQRFWPRCLLQAAKTGLWYLTEIEPRSNLDRGVEVENHVTYKVISLDSLDDDPNSRLGFDFAIYSGVAGSGCAARELPCGAHWLHVCLQNLYEQKSEHTKVYMAPKTEPRRQAVSVCNLLK